MSESGSAGARRLVRSIEAICRNLPEVTREVDGHGRTVFRVGRRTFAAVGGGRTGAGSLFVKTDPASQEILIRRGPWESAPYIGRHGWVWLEGDAEVDPDELRDLVTDAYRRVAPRRLRDL